MTLFIITYDNYLKYYWEKLYKWLFAGLYLLKESYKMIAIDLMLDLRLDVFDAGFDVRCMYY